MLQNASHCRSIWSTFVAVLQLWLHHFHYLSPSCLYTVVFIKGTNDGYSVKWVTSLFLFYFLETLIGNPTFAFTWDLKRVTHLTVWWRRCVTSDQHFSKHHYTKLQIHPLNNSWHISISHIDFRQDVWKRLWGVCPQGPLSTKSNNS